MFNDKKFEFEEQISAEWHHVAFTYDGNNRRAYLDREEIILGNHDESIFFFLEIMKLTFSFVE